MQQHISISKPFMQELLIYQFSNCCRGVSDEKYNQRWKFSIQAEGFWEKRSSMVLVIADSVISYCHSLISYAALYNQ
jgi:hypothetical protein